jgi:Fur family ferric uptake transcriptional regulator
MRIRVTKQKEILEETVKRFSKFFSAEEFLYEVKKKDKRMGIATVYRFLRELENSKKIHSYTCRRKRVYSTTKKSHCHFVCEKCGKVEHFEISEVDFIEEKIKGEVCHFQIDVSGVCEKCKKKFL